MKNLLLAAVGLAVLPTGSFAEDTSADEAVIKAIIADIERGWEQGDGTPFREHYLDFEGARYIESGGQNEGLDDLILHHVEPEKDAIANFEVDHNDIEVHFENGFAWAVADTRVKGEIVETGRVIDKAGRATFLFRQIGDDWKVVHTHSSSRDYRPAE